MTRSPAHHTAATDASPTAAVPRRGAALAALRVFALYASR
jgi:hypothetical protein